ncbi:MAG TPA: aspartate kinase, partial [Myxococcaceae bacterium]|nr:aspartate kinase [Myxococcaceae bacterium]
MPIVVQKYGGSSVAGVEKLRKVALRVKETRERGYQVVVVVSAMGDTTDELLALARQVSADPPRRELDMLLTCGERISMALLSMALQELGVPAISFTGSQSGIITNDAHSQARIVEVRPYRIQDELARGKVVIVAGYQGVSYKKEVTTLGRGGSDTTAVALAAALSAESCEIYSDVDGVFSADPRVVPEARKQEALSYDEMQELASAGAKVLNAQAVEFAKEKGIVILARTAHGRGSGTAVQEYVAPADTRVKGVTAEVELAVLSAELEGGRLSELLEFLDARGVRGRALAFDGLEGRAGRAFVAV